MTTDLIAQKTSEFENLPGLVLGLDGWLLRSLPKELRGQFLNGYEKLLKIVFHPDRFQDPAKKKSREAYLQTVGEAVRFMLSDEFSYEVATDSVPSRRNPMVALKSAVEVRDNIINRLDDDIKDTRAEATQAGLEIARLTKELSDLRVLTAKRVEVAHRLRMVTRKIVHRYPVPVLASFSRVTGRYLNFQPSELVDEISRLSSRHEIDADHPWIKDGSWVKSASRQKLLEDAATLKLERGSFVGGRVVGAMTIAHLCEWIRHRNRFDDLSPEKALSDLQYISVKRDEQGLEPIRIEMFGFMLPFYTRNTLLVIQPHKPEDKTAGEWHRYRLFVVDSADAEDGQLVAQCNALKDKCHAAQSELSKATKTVAILKAQKSELKARLKAKKQKAKP